MRRPARTPDKSSRLLLQALAAQGSKENNARPPKYAGIAQLVEQGFCNALRDTVKRCKLADLTEKVSKIVSE